MNPTKAQLLSDLSDAFDSVTMSTSALTETELRDCFNKMLEVAESVDPIKGKPTVKHKVEFE